MSVFGPDLGPASAPAEWDWLPDALGEPYTVGALAPKGHDAVVRLAHVDSDVHGLPAPVLTSLVELGRPHTATPERAVFAIWDGYGWDSAQMASARTEPRRLFRRSPPPADPLAPAKELLAAELATLPTLEVPDRRYHLLTGPLAAVVDMNDPIALWSRFVPDLFWPADRAWFVAGDVDLEWSYLTGPLALIESVEEAWPDRSRRVDRDEPIA